MCIIEGKVNIHMGIRHVISMFSVISDLSHLVKDAFNFHFCLIDAHNLKLPLY